ELWEVMDGHERAVARVVVGDALGDIRLVEDVASRADGRATAARAGCRLRRHHHLDGLGELRLDEQMPRRRPLAAFQVYGGGGREATDLLGRAAELIRGEDGEGKATLGAPESGRNRLPEALRPPALEGGAPRIGRSGHHRAQETHGNLAAARLAEEVRG